MPPRPSRPRTMLLAIALAGAAGTLARYGVTTLVQRAGSTLPYGTLIVNVLGSFLLGLLLRHGPEAGTSPSALRLALTVGFCGGFTTFSAFSAETALLLQSGAYTRAALYATTSVLLSLAAVFAGFALTR